MKCELTPKIRKMMEEKIARSLAKGEEIHCLVDSPTSADDLQLMRNQRLHLIHHSKPTLEAIFMGLAEKLSLRTNCSRMNHACGITDKSMTTIYSIGYNGQPKGFPHSGCKGWIQGGCGCAHAEQNALAMLTARDPEKVFFITGEPCNICATLIINSGASQVIIRGTHYRPVEGVDLLKRAGILVTRLG